jgi:hypothetical protein
VNFIQLAVSQCRGALRLGRGGVEDHFNIEDGRHRASRRSERADDQASLERRLGQEELQGQVLVVLLLVSTPSPAKHGRWAYNLNAAGSRLLQPEGIGRFESRGLLDHQEGLVRPLRPRAFLGRQRNFERIGVA